MASTDCDLWAQIVEVHNEAKTLFLLAEELEHEKFQDFIQPINEHRHSQEHIVRAKANELGLDGSEPSEKYQCDCLQKALGHEYRAFFDCADWIAIILREDILRTLKPYDVPCIQAAIPAYYGRLRSRIDEISSDIASMRGRKDISRDDTILVEVQNYKAVVDELRNIRKEIVQAVPALEDHRARSRRMTCKDWILKSLVPVAAAAILAVGAFIWGRLTK